MIEFGNGRLFYDVMLPVLVGCFDNVRNYDVIKHWQNRLFLHFRVNLPGLFLLIKYIDNTQLSHHKGNQKTKTKTSCKLLSGKETIFIQTTYNNNNVSRYHISTTSTSTSLFASNAQKKCKPCILLSDGLTKDGR